MIFPLLAMMFSCILPAMAKRWAKKWLAGLSDLVSGRARSWLYATLVTVLLAITGLLGSVFSKDIGSAFPFYWGWNLRAVVFWVSLLLTALVFAIRQWSVNQALSETTNELKRLIRTMPPRGFLVTFEEIHQQCEAALWAALGPNQASKQEVVAVAIRHVLRGIALLASKFDDADDDVTYAANIMLFKERSDIRPEDESTLRSRMRFDLETNLDDLLGILDLRLNFSSTASSKKSEPDGSLVPLALAIPKRHKTTIGGEQQQRWRVMPGAPIAFIEKEPDYYRDTSDLQKWCADHGDFTMEARQRVAEYFREGEGPPVRSFISLPLCDVDSDVPVGILNIHRSKPNLLMAEGEPVGHFAAIVQPLLLMLLRLLKAHVSLEGVS